MSHASDQHEARPRFLQIQFADHGQQLEAVRFGMWAFLGSEILFFGALFALYTVFRGNHPEIFHYGRLFLDWRMGMLNTFVLIGSSLAAAWSVRCAQTNNQKGLMMTLVITLACACIFMAVKYLEYSHKLHNGVFWGAHFAPSQEILESLPEAARHAMPAFAGTFFTIYFLMTGLHGIHVLIGMGLYGWLIRRAARGDFGPDYYGPVDMVALYWHLVDLIWIFLFPLLYLVG